MVRFIQKFISWFVFTRVCLVKVGKISKVLHTQGLSCIVVVCTVSTLLQYYFVQPHESDCKINELQYCQAQPAPLAWLSWSYFLFIWSEFCTAQSKLPFLSFFNQLSFFITWSDIQIKSSNNDTKVTYEYLQFSEGHLLFSKDYWRKSKL